MVDDTAASRGLGGRIAAGVAKHLVGATVATRAQTTPLQRAVGAQILSDFFEGTGAELRATMGPTFSMLAQHPDTPDDMRKLFGFLARGKGEMASFIGGSLTGSVLSGGLGDLVTNALAPVVHRVIEAFPNGLIPVGQAVDAYVRGMAGDFDMRAEVAQQGLSVDKFDVLAELARNRPDVSIILDLVNRGEMNIDFAMAQLQRLGYNTGDAGLILATRFMVIDPARLADLVTFGVLTEEDAVPVAGRSGMSADDFHLLVLGNGTPPSNEDLAFAYRRGVIDRDRFIRGLTQSSLRNEWIPFVEKMVLQPMSVADAIDAVVQNAITEDQGREITRQNGLIPEHFDPLLAINGSPPGPQEMIAMWHRGILTRDGVVQGLKESRLKNKYVEPLLALSETLPPERTIVSLVAKNAITPDRGMQLLLERGYAPDIAQALLAEAHATKTAATRDLTATQMVALYEDHAITQQQAQDMLSSLGYDDEEIGWILALADLRRLKKFNDAAIARVHSLYVAYKVDDTGATTTLDALGIAPDQRNDLLTLWQIERTVNTKQLTLAQIEAAYKKKVLTGQDMFDRLQGIGYAADDAAIIVETLGVDLATLT